MNQAHICIRARLNQIEKSCDQNYNFQLLKAKDKLPLILVLNNNNNKIMLERSNLIKVE